MINGTLAASHKTSRLRCAVALVAAVPLAVALLARDGAGQTIDQDAVRSAAEALDGYENFPWYNQEQDGLRRIEVERPNDLKNRSSRWQRNPTTWSWPSWAGSLLEAIVWIILATLIALLVYAMVRVFLSHEIQPTASHRARVHSTAEADRVDNLPFQLERSDVDLLAEAKRLYEQARFGDAIIYLYSYQLLQLDQHQAIRLTKGKTNRQYLRELRRRPPLRNLLQATMVAFEDVFFGNHLLDRPGFELCWRRLDDFHRELGGQPT